MIKNAPDPISNAIIDKHFGINANQKKTLTSECTGPFPDHAKQGCGWGQTLSTAIAYSTLLEMPIYSIKMHYVHLLKLPSKVRVKLQMIPFKHAREYSSKMLSYHMINYFFREEKGKWESLFRHGKKKQIERKKPYSSISSKKL